MGSITFGQNASFKSIVSRCDGLDFMDEDSTLEGRLKSMAGPQQPAMNPTEQDKANHKTVVPTLHPNDDPNWNGPRKDV